MRSNSALLCRRAKCHIDRFRYLIVVVYTQGIMEKWKQGAKVRKRRKPEEPSTTSRQPPNSQVNSDSLPAQIPLPENIVRPDNPSILDRWLVLCCVLDPNGPPPGDVADQSYPCPKLLGLLCRRNIGSPSLRVGGEMG
jgi:hypothetical protein